MSNSYSMVNTADQSMVWGPKFHITQTKKKKKKIFVCDSPLKLQLVAHMILLIIYLGKPLKMVGQYRR